MTNTTTTTTSAVRFKKVSAAFHDVTRVRSFDSSGSEHSADLSVLVNSFFEREIREQKRKINEEASDRDIDQMNYESNHVDIHESENNSSDLELRNSLKNCFDSGNDVVRRSIHAEVEKASVELGESSSPEFKRRLMNRLRNKGFDAGLCKTKWEKNGSCSTSGSYEYIDININETRYIIEVSLAGEFTIARPTSQYSSLLQVFPPIFVGKTDELKQVVRLMSKAIRKSMKSMNIHVSPWRRLAYLQAKWFGSYKRTTAEISGLKASKFGGDDLARKRSVGFVPMGGISFNCREQFVANGGGRIGNLAAALMQEEIAL